LAWFPQSSIEHQRRRPGRDESTNRTVHSGPEHSLIRLMTHLEESETQFVAGDAEGYKSLWSRGEDVAVMGAFGGHETGWEEVGPRLDWAAAHVRSDGYDFEVLAEYVTDEMGCRVGLQHGGDGRTLRVTELFRKEGGWRLVHRHADWLVPKGDTSVMR
jgi:ketosteroid isomerase-like protein